MISEQKKTEKSSNRLFTVVLFMVITELLTKYTNDWRHVNAHENIRELSKAV